MGYCKVIFWFSLSVTIYSYILYPLAIILRAKMIPRKIERKDNCKSISIVLPLKNEEQNIKGRLLNLIKQSGIYGQKEIIVICDGSTDDTEKIVRKFFIDSEYELGRQNIKHKIISYEKSCGKAQALNLGVKSAENEILVFADARQQFDTMAISELLKNFSDSTIGCVSGELILPKDPNNDIGEEIGVYWKYEKNLRKAESRIYATSGATGAIYAIRKKLFKNMPMNLILDDVYQPMNAILNGYRAVMDDRALAYDKPTQRAGAERKRKIRTLYGNWQLLVFMPDILNPFKNRIILQYISHRIMGRMMVPFCLILCMVSSLFISGFIYRIFILCSIIGLMMPLYEKMVPIRGGVLKRIIGVARALFNLNYCALIGFWYFIRHKEDVW